MKRDFTKRKNKSKGQSLKSKSILKEERSDGERFDLSGEGQSLAKKHFSPSTKLFILIAVVVVPIFSYFIFTALGGTTFNITLGRDTLEKGLIGHWTFDGKDMTQNVADTSGQGNTGYLSGQTSTTTVLGRIGQALDFDGVDDYVSVSSTKILSGLTDLTISAWINTSTTGEDSIYTERGSSGLDILKLEMQHPNYTEGAIELTYRDDAGTLNRVQSSTLINDSKWHYVTVTKNGTSIILYIDGIEDQTSTLTASNTFTNGTIDSRIGGDQGDGTSNFPGKLDDVRIYNRALSADEVQRLYKLGATTKINKTLDRSGTTLESGLVGHWTFDGKDMIQNVADTSGQGNTGYLNGQTSTTTVLGRIGQALDFDGVDDYVSVIDPGYNSPTASWSAWFYADTVAGYQRIIDEGGDKRFTISSGSTAGKVKAIIYTSTTSISVSLPTAISAKKWYHVAVTYDKVNVKLYLDGVEQDSVTHDGDLGVIESWRDPTIGKAWVGGGYWDGTLDDVRIYNRALSADEVQRLYKLGATTKINKTLDRSGTTLESGLVGHWTFDGPDMIQNVADTSGQGNTGYLNGQTSTTTSIGKIGQALDFDGVNDYVTVGNIGSGVKTISFWMKADDITSRKIINIDGTDQIEIDASSNIVATSFPASTIYIDSSSVSPTVGTGWHHVVITDSTGVSGSTFEIGRVSTGYFDGKIDDVRIYNRALSADEVQRLYQLGATTKINETSPSGPPGGGIPAP